MFSDDWKLDIQFDICFLSVSELVYVISSISSKQHWEGFTYSYAKELCIKIGFYVYMCKNKECTKYFCFFFKYYTFKNKTCL